MLARAELGADPNGPLFRSAGVLRGSDQLRRRPLLRRNARAMIKRRAGAAGLRLRSVHTASGEQALPNISERGGR